MTRDDIIRMAIKCQLVTTGYRDGLYSEALERFANLVAEAEREACAREVERFLIMSGEAVWQPIHFCDGIATAIRARGEK